MNDSQVSLEAIKPEDVPSNALNRIPVALCLANPKLDDTPLVYANTSFEALTGYKLDSVIGRNCRFLQGEKTEADKVEKLREGLSRGDDVTVVLTNYRADGSTFRNRLTVSPVANSEEDVVLYLGVLREDGRQEPDFLDKLGELQHRVKNHLSMLIGLIRLQAAGSEAASDYQMLARRIETLQLLYQELDETGVASAHASTVPLGAYVSRIATAIGHMDGRAGIRNNVDAEEIEVGVNVATQVGLLLSEVLTNAYKHAFEDRDTGLVETRLMKLSDGTIRLQVIDDGIGMAEGATWPSESRNGSRIVKSLLRGLRCGHGVDSSTAGTTITIDVPAEIAARRTDRA